MFRIPTLSYLQRYNNIRDNTGFRIPPQIQNYLALITGAGDLNEHTNEFGQTYFGILIKQSGFVFIAL